MIPKHYALWFGVSFYEVKEFTCPECGSHYFSSIEEFKLNEDSSDRRKYIRNCGGIGEELSVKGLQAWMRRAPWERDPKSSCVFSFHEDQDELYFNGTGRFLPSGMEVVRICRNSEQESKS